MSDLDVVLITYNRARYTELSLPRLLDGCPEGSRVWVWHNGTDPDVLAVIDRYRDHPRFHRFHHSVENVGLRPAINWLWREAEGTYLSKVDDDSLMEPGWVEFLTGALAAWPGFGVLGSWRFLPEDFDEALARQKTETLHGVTVLKNLWVQGSGHVFRRDLVAEVGLLTEGQSFPGWCIEVARRGYVNGWPIPFVREEHMDDPRHEHTVFTDDAAFLSNRPLSAKATGVATVAEWLAQTRHDALTVQRASLDVRARTGWRRKVVHGRRRLQKMVTGRSPWT